PAVMAATPPLKEVPTLPATAPGAPTEVGRPVESKPEDLEPAAPLPVGTAPPGQRRPRGGPSAFATERGEEERGSGAPSPSGEGGGEGRRSDEPLAALGPLTPNPSPPQGRGERNSPCRQRGQVVLQRLLLLALPVAEFLELGLVLLDPGLLLVELLQVTLVRL